MRVWRLTCSYVLYLFKPSSVCVRIARRVFPIECMAKPANVIIECGCIMRCPA
ncbi:hypothetical protein Hanom_Chr14g01274421 [Helianthus anomalus]